MLALIVILFDGGMRVGWRRFRETALPIVSLGLLGDLRDRRADVLAAHYCSGSRGRPPACSAQHWLLRPAVMFSVFGRKEIAGRTGAILEGESGANDPVGIALMLAASASLSGLTSVAHAVGEFILELGAGSVRAAVRSELRAADA